MKTNFLKAANRLFDLCERIDSHPECIEDFVVKEFKETLTRATTPTLVDEHKAIYRELCSKIDMAKEFQDAVARELKKYENLKDKFEELTKQVLLENPGIKFKDSLGKALILKKNSQYKVVIKPGVSVPDEYYRTLVKKEIDKEKIKDDILSGAAFDFAHIERDFHLSGHK